MIKKVDTKIRVQALFNTGTRIEKPKKGKGSYTRCNKHKQNYIPYKVLEIF